MPDMYEMHIEYINVDALTPYEKNARKHEKEDLQTIIESIKAFGFRDPIGVWGKHNIIVEGHGRLLAAKALGMTEVPCIRLDDLTDEQRRAYTLAHNQTTDNSSFDLDALNEELADLDSLGLDFDMSDFGFDMSFLAEEPEAVEDDYSVALPDEAKTKPGDIYILGRHRLMCGDSTDSVAFDKLMNGQKANIAFTSPPYGVGLDYNEYDDSFKNTNELIHNVLPLVCEHVTDYIIINWGDIVSARDINGTEQPSMFSWLPTYIKIMQKNGWNIWAERIWKKVHARCAGVWSANSNRPVSDWEYIFTWAKGTPSCNERKDGSHFGIIDSAETSESDTLSRHPGAFPVYVAAKVVQIHTAEDAIVLDPFGGSGSTLIACEQLNRSCYMMELDPKYCDVIIDRWEQFTGQKAVKEVNEDAKQSAEQPY